MSSIQAIFDEVRGPDDEGPYPVRPTTAERLVEYRNELLAAGFPADQVAEMLSRAAANPDGFETRADREREERWAREAMRASMFAWKLEAHARLARTEPDIPVTSASPDEQHDRRWSAYIRRILALERSDA